jgi:2TM domain
MQQGTATEATRLTTEENRQRLEDAKRRVAALKGFYIHLIVFMAVNLGLTVLNIATGDDWWVQWVWLGWGIGVLAHAIAVFGRGPKSVKNWENRKIRQFLDKK